jgi:RNA polymerase sigma-70 factor (ECF subfamily)
MRELLWQTKPGLTQSRHELVPAGVALPPVDAASSELHAAPHGDDQSLVERLVRCDAAAWQAFIDTHGRLVRARVADVASSFGRSDDDSAIDDATAEVFAALLRNNAAALRAFAGRSSLGTYVAVIATRSATRGFARRVPVTSAIEPANVAQTACDPSIKDPACELIEAEQKHRLHCLLDRLPPKQRHVLSMFHLQEKSYAEISKDLDMPIGSIGPTLRRAEAKLRTWMEDEEQL